MKKLLLSCGLAGVIGVGASLAYFSDVTGTLTNKFTMFGAGTDSAPVDLLVKENNVQEDRDANGVVAGYKKIEGDWKQSDTSGQNQEITYANLLPGSHVDKNPTVVVKANTTNSVVVVKIVGLDNEQEKYIIENSKLGSEWKLINNAVSKTSNENAKFYQYNEYVDTTDGTPDEFTLFTGLKINENIDTKTTIDSIVVSAAAVQITNNEDALAQAVDALGGTLQ